MNRLRFSPPLRSLFLLLPVLLGAQAEAPPRAPVVTVEGREIAASVALGSAGPLVALSPVAEALGGKLGPGEGGSYLLSIGDTQVVLAAGSPVVTVGSEIFSLSQPVTPGGGGVMVPLDLLRKTFGDLAGWSIDWQAEGSRLVIAKRQARLVPVAIDVVHLQGTTTVVLQFPAVPRYKIDQLPGRIEVRMLGDRISASMASTLDDPLVEGVDPSPDRLVIRLLRGATADSYTLENPFRIVFDVHQPGPTTGPVGGLAPAIDRPGIRTIVIDPGHGGTETGAIGPSGVQEKELTLLLARALASQLAERLGVRTELTRTNDSVISFDARTALANQNKADLFISIHLNSSLGTGAHGAETYFLANRATDPRAASSANVENGTADDGSGLADPAALQDLQLMLWDLAQSRYLEQSQRLANMIQGELNQALDLKDRGVKQAPFRVLVGAAMPAVLVELGFISNPDEEKKLQDAGYRAQLVDALVRAVGHYKELVEARPAPAGEAPGAPGLNTDESAPAPSSPAPAAPAPAPPGARPKAPR
ncbi:MAG TPA: N-acetylmuramoyl-L-alanine amidase [Thermoanaerobaculia bacterium]|nr:N-acetylmuramoyl-L-alanine amidase [Thermoanaerobaculia bacterium]